MATKYADDLAEIIQAIEDDGAPFYVVAGETPREYDDVNDRVTGGEPILLRSNAVQDEGDPDVIDKLDLAGVDNETLWVAPEFRNAAGVVVPFDPPPNVEFLWAGKRFTTRKLSDVAPDGTPLVYNFVGSR